MRFSIDYRTAYRYSEPVSEQHNALRVKPAETDHQRCESFRIEVTPEARQYRYTDYFGTEVVEFDLPERHSRLEIAVHADVITRERPDPEEVGPAGLAAEGYATGEEEFLDVSWEHSTDERITELTAAISAETPLATLLEVCDLIPDRFDYRSGATYVGSTVDDLLRGGAGVCQDFVHLALLVLRRRGIAARYVSGYLFAAAEDGGADSVEVDTHAWLEALIPTSSGEAEWLGGDPTNRGLAREHHVKIGHGREYADVPPVKGVYRGGNGSELDANVRMTRVG